METLNPPTGGAMGGCVSPPHSPGGDDTPSEADTALLALERPHPNLLWLYTIQALAATILAPIVWLPFFFKFKTLRYKLDEEGISASWGILFRKEIYLTYKRIQDIHVKRNIVERWLGIAKIELQTASGSADSELALEGMENYEAVRDFLYRRMRGHELVKPSPEAAMPIAAGDTAEADVVALLKGIRTELEGARRALEARR